MPSRTGTLVSVSVVRGPDDQITNGRNVMNFEIQVQNNTASTVDAAADTLDIAALGVAIRNALRRTETFTPVAVAGARPALVGSVEYGMTVALSSGTLQIVPRSSADWSSNAVLPANTTTTFRPFTVYVTCQVS